MNDFYVYILRDPRKDNEPFYIGKGRGNRHRHHFTKCKVKEENRHKKIRIKSIEDAGFSVVVEKYREHLSAEEAYDLEAELILKWGRKSYDPNGILTNVCIDRRPPDHTGILRTEETKRKIGDALRGKPKSEEHRKALSEVASGSNNHNWGKSWDQDTKARIQASNVNAPSPNKRANWDEVREIRLMHRLGHKAKTIHERFDHMSLQTVRDIIAERTWKEEFRPR